MRGNYRFDKVIPLSFLRSSKETHTRAVPEPNTRKQREACLYSAIQNKT